MVDQNENCPFDLNGFSGFQFEMQFKINISVRAGTEIIVLCYFHSSTSFCH